MKVTLVEKGQNVLADGEGGLIIKTPRQIQFLGNRPQYISGLGPIKVLSGSAKFRFKLPRDLAVQGVILHGAYIGGTGDVGGVFSSITPEALLVPAGGALLIAETIDIGVISTVHEGTLFQNGVVNLTPPKAPNKKRKRKAV